MTEFQTFFIGGTDHLCLSGLQFLSWTWKSYTANGFSIVPCPPHISEIRFYLKIYGKFEYFLDIYTLDRSIEASCQRGILSEVCAVGCPEKQPVAQNNWLSYMWVNIYNSWVFMHFWRAATYFCINTNFSEKYTSNLGIDQFLNAHLSNIYFFSSFQRTTFLEAKRVEQHPTW